MKKAIPRSEQHQNQQQQQPQHSVTEPQNSQSSKNSNKGNINNHFRTKKIFVGGLSASLTEEQFKNYFEKFGRIIDVVVMHDNMTNRPRGFGFVTFDSEESVENVMQKTFHELNGRLVEVKKAVPKEEINGNTGGYNTRVSGRNDSPYSFSLPINYPPYSPGYGVPPCYAPLPGYSGPEQFTSGAGIFGGGYPMVPYGKYGYGVAPIAARTPWCGPVMIQAGACSLPYGNTSICPAYVNNGIGVMGMVPGGYNGIVGAGMDGKLSQVLGDNGHLLYNATPSRTEGMKLDVDSMGLNGSNSGASGEQNQRGLDGKFKPLPVVNSR